MSDKPLGRKNYGSIPHLQDSRLGPTESHIEEGQERIATKEVRDRWDLVIVQEKLDGSNVGVAKINGEIVALTRAGYAVSTSPYNQHHKFGQYVEREKKRFDGLLDEGDRVVGEWLLVAHGTMYDLTHEPFVPFDIMREAVRINYHNFLQRVSLYEFPTPNLLHMGGGLTIKLFEKLIGAGKHGAERVEGGIWRVERKGIVDFLCKYVRRDKEDGKYFVDDGEVFNDVPPKFEYLKK